MILEICDVPEVLKTLRIVRIILLMIRIIVPILLIVYVTKDGISDLTSNEGKLNIKKQTTRVVAAIIIFFIPTIVGFVFTLTGNKEVYTSCYSNATSEGINKAYINTSGTYINKVKSTLKESDYNLAKSYIKNVSDKDTKNELLNDLSTYEEYVKINSLISKLISKYDSSLYKETKARISKLPDNDMKSMLEEKLKSIKSFVRNETGSDNIGIYHINGYTNIKYYLYSQCEGSWQNRSIGNGSTFCAIGCGLTTCTVIITSYNSSVTPENSISFGDDYHHDTVISSQTDGNYNCTKYTNSDIYNQSTSKSTITEAMKQGAVLSLKVWGKNRGGASHFTSSQHFMAIIDYDEEQDQMFVGNYYGNGTYSTYGWFKSDEVLTTVKDVVICYPSQKLISKYK